MNVISEQRGQEKVPQIPQTVSERKGERGEETRDLLACSFVSRGWEARTVVVMDCNKFVNPSENLAMRAVSRLVVVRCKVVR